MKPFAFSAHLLNNLVFEALPYGAMFYTLVNISAGHPPRTAVLPDLKISNTQINLLRIYLAKTHKSRLVIDVSEGYPQTSADEKGRCRISLTPFSLYDCFACAKLRLAGIDCVVSASVYNVQGNRDSRPL